MLDAAEQYRGQGRPVQWWRRGWRRWRWVSVGGSWWRGVGVAVCVAVGRSARRGTSSASVSAGRRVTRCVTVGVGGSGDGVGVGGWRLGWRWPQGRGPGPWRDHRPTPRAVLKRTAGGRGEGQTPNGRVASAPPGHRSAGSLQQRAIAARPALRWPAGQAISNAFLSEVLLAPSHINSIAFCISICKNVILRGFGRLWRCTLAAFNLTEHSGRTRNRSTGNRHRHDCRDTSGNQSRSRRDTYSRQPAEPWLRSGWRPRKGAPGALGAASGPRQARRQLKHALSPASGDVATAVQPISGPLAVDPDAQGFFVITLVVTASQQHLALSGSTASVAVNAAPGARR